MLLLLLACADDSAVLAALAPTLDPVAADALVGAYTPTDWNMHALVIEAGAVRLHDEGDEFIGASSFGSGAYPVIDTGAGVRVLASDREVRTLLWLDREALMDVVAETVWVNGDGQPVRGLEAGIRIASGTQTFRDERGTWSRLDGDFVHAEVAISPSLVDQVWIDPSSTEYNEAHAPLESADVPIQGETLILDDEGRELVTLEGDDGVGVATVAVLARDTARGALILLDTGYGQLVRGWVNPDRLQANAFIGFGHGWSCGCCGWGRFRAGGDGYEPLPRGAVLYASPGGEVIGLTEAAVSLFRRSPPADGWVHVDVSTPFGTAPLWVRHDELDPTIDDIEAEAAAEAALRLAGADIEIRALDAWN